MCKYSMYSVSFLYYYFVFKDTTIVKPDNSITFNVLLLPYSIHPCSVRHHLAITSHLPPLDESVTILAEVQSTKILLAVRLHSSFTCLNCSIIRLLKYFSKLKSLKIPKLKIFILVFSLFFMKGCLAAIFRSGSPPRICR